MIRMHCEKCGGENVMLDAYAQWSVEAQEWELCSTFDNAVCDDCGGECNIEEVEIEGVAPALANAAPDYLDRFPADHRASADRAYQDGYIDGVNDKQDDT